jgi:RNA recognition motif-containing protein
VTGESSLNYYSKAKEATPQIVDMVVSNLPKHFDEKALRKVSGSKHIISAVVDVDNFTGSCKGTGRIQIRLNHGETADSVRLNFLRLGYKVEDF